MVAGGQKIIDGFSLDNVLQISAMEKKSITFGVSTLGRHGLLDMAKGELINAETGEMAGQDAAIEILCWKNTQVELRPLRQIPRVISTPLIKLLFQASKIVDEREADNKIIDPGVLDKAIEYAEAHHYKKAHAILVPFLKNNRHNTRGWLWYSRIKGNLEAMGKALDIASDISPDDQAVEAEVKKFKAAKAKLTKRKTRKCLFCWAPLDGDAKYCHNCHGYLTISKDSLGDRNRPDPVVFNDNVARYKRVLQREPKLISGHYCLSLTYLNLGKFEKALHYLDMVVKLAPDKHQLAMQLSLLLDHMASSVEEGQEVQTQQAAPTGETTAAPKVSLEPSEEEAGSGQKTILVVEDSSTTRKVITVTLKRNGYRIIEAVDGLEALSRISEYKPDLVLLDLILPKMDGYKILSIIKGNREYQNIPVIMLTSKDGFINKVKGKMAGSAAYLTKPFDPGKMIQTIEKHI